MPAPSGKVPSYCLHKASGRAVVRLNGRDRYLGPDGSPESHERYARLIAEWQSLPRANDVINSEETVCSSNSLSVNEIMLAYVEFAKSYYTKDGQPNQEFESIRYALRPLRQLYGHKQAAAFGPRDLKTLRQQLVDRGLSRTYINNNTNRIKRMFKWAVGEELVPPSVYQALQTVTGLRYGRSEACETEPVKPVPDAYVDAVLPYVAPPVAAMIRLQRLTGKGDARAREWLSQCLLGEDRVSLVQIAAKEKVGLSSDAEIDSATIRKLLWQLATGGDGFSARLVAGILGPHLQPDPKPIENAATAPV